MVLYWGRLCWDCGGPLINHTDVIGRWEPHVRCRTEHWPHALSPLWLTPNRDRGRRRAGEKRRGWGWGGWQKTERWGSEENIEEPQSLEHRVSLECPLYTHHIDLNNIDQNIMEQNVTHSQTFLWEVNKTSERPKRALRSLQHIEYYCEWHCSHWGVCVCVCVPLPLWEIDLDPFHSSLF